jgi:hypothetical protein
MFTCCPPIFSYFLGSFIGIGSSLFSIFFSIHTDNPEIHKCRFVFAKAKPLPKVDLNIFNSHLKACKSFLVLKTQWALIFPFLENVFVMDTALEHS